MLVSNERKNIAGIEIGFGADRFAQIKRPEDLDKRSKADALSNAMTGLAL